MKSLIRITATMGAAALLAACGGSQAPISAPAVNLLNQSRAVGNGLSPASASDLVYVTNGCGGTCIVSYPEGKVVGHLDVGNGLNAGVCADGQGNVYVSHNSDSQGSEVVEYAHGGTTPIATFGLPGVAAAGCSVDPTSGNLAVMFQDSDYNVAIFTTGSQEPELYSARVGGFSCAYDPSGDLFVGGLYDGEAALSELPNGGSNFEALSLKDTEAIQGAGQVQWYGKYLSYTSAFGGYAFIYRLSISGTSATVVETTHLAGEKWLWYPWIYQGKILVPYTRRHLYADTLGIWDYPKGGRVARKFASFGSSGLESVTVSVGSKGR